MLSKVVLIICDGLADRPIPDLADQTPLEAAATPNLDRLAAEGECGMMHTLGRGRRPASDTAHLAIMGYDPDNCYAGRGPIEVAGIGLTLEHGDVALRGNFGTVETVGGEWLVKDRRGGRIRDVSPLTAALDGIEVKGVKFTIRPGTAHRAGIVMKGESLSGAITDSDPHEPNAKVRLVAPKDDTSEAKRTADVLNVFLEESHGILETLPFNQDRVKSNLLPINFLLVRGAGMYRELQPFNERYGVRSCCIAGGGLYKGIGAFLGMHVLDVPGTTGLPDTDVAAKVRAAVTALNDYDFVFMHIKAADSLGEDNNPRGKMEFIEKIDAALSSHADLPSETLVVVTADHTTPCVLMQHSADPVPILFHGRGVRVDDVRSFGERACARGGLGHISGLDLMPHVINLLGRSPLIGA